MIEMGNSGVIVRQVLAHYLRRARMRRQFFVADVQLAIIERVIGHEVLRQAELRRIVEFNEFRRREPRVMRHGRREINEKWFLAIVTFEELDGFVGVFRGREGGPALSRDINLESGEAESAGVAS